jgi:FtsZ-interacting cell division protein ZipA
MSTGAIIVIAVVAAIVLIALLALMPRMRERGRARKQERELQTRREQAASSHREEADSRAARAEAAERRARMAEQEARRERAEAELHRERATASERGMADEEILGTRERAHFADTTTAPDAELATGRDSEGGLLGRFGYRSSRDQQTTGRRS